jgi:hypothetical protein
MAVQPRPAEDRSDLIFRFNTDQYQDFRLSWLISSNAGIS